jgi:PAS domain S-box-containing protein
VMALLAPGWAQPTTHAGRHVIVGGDHDYPPYEYLDVDGNPAGYNVDLTRAVARAMGLDVTIRLGPWGEIREALETGEIDAIHGMFYSSQRDEQVDFSPPHTVINHGIFVRDDAPPIASLQDLRGQTVLVMDGDIMHDFLAQQDLDVQIVAEPTQEEALQKLAAGQGDAALVARLPGLFWIKERGWSNLEVTGPTLRPSECCFAVREGDQRLQAAFTEGLAIVKNTGQYRTIYDRHLGVLEPQGMTVGEVLGILAWVAGPILAVLVLVLLWVASMRRVVRRQTADLREQVIERRQAEARWRAVFESAPLGMFSLMFDTGAVQVNAALEKMLGYSPDELAGMDWREFTHPEDVAAEEPLAAQLRAGQRDYYRVEKRCLHRDGRVVRVSLNVSLIRDADNRPWQIMVLAEDITARYRTEQILQQSEALYRGLFDHSLNAIVICHALRDPTGQMTDFEVLEANPAFEHHLGMRFDQLESTIASEFLSESDFNELLERYRWVVENAQGDHFDIEMTSFGRLLEVETFSLRDDQFAVLFTDITQQRVIEQQRREMESRMQQAQKMESLGVLAGGIAHDFNNLLVAILGNADMILADLDRDDPLCETVQEIKMASQRCSQLTRQMLAYSGRGTYMTRPIELNPQVRDMVRLVRATLPPTIDVQTTLSEPLPYVLGDAGQLGQVILNLLTNASEAIGENNGTIRLKTKLVNCDPSRLENVHAAEDIQPGPFVCLEVSDSGCGMDASVRQRMFDPFFTTKFTGRGLGLGVVLGIVRGHHGALQVESKPTEGTTIRVYLPIANEDDQTPAEPSPPPPAATNWRGRGRVLIVEDEASVREFNERLLKRLGFDVVSAEDGGRALEQFRQDHANLTLVLLDLTMPGMDGHQVAREIRAINAGVPIILCSGYARQQVLEDFSDEPVAGFLQKPFGVAELVDLLRKILDSDESDPPERHRQG